MEHGTLRGSWLAACVALATAIGSSRSAAQSHADLVVRATGFRSDRGSLRCVLYDRAEDFPTHADRARARVSAPIADRGATCRFAGVEPGTYAVALHHDEDGEGDFDTGIFGIPTEGTGASRDARGSMGPPSFRDAAFEHGATTTSLDVHITYAF